VRDGDLTRCSTVSIVRGNDIVPSSTARSSTEIDAYVPDLERERLSCEAWLPSEMGPELYHQLEALKRRRWPRATYHPVATWGVRPREGWDDMII